jgi:hypothetical protein
VTLFDGGVPLWTWDVVPGAFDTYVSPPLGLSGRSGRLRIESDGAVGRARLRSRFEGERSPASLVVRAICLRPAEAEELQRSAGVIVRGPDDGSRVRTR